MDPSRSRFGRPVLAAVACVAAMALGACSADEPTASPATTPTSPTAGTPGASAPLEAACAPIAAAVEQGKADATSMPSALPERIEAGMRISVALYEAVAASAPEPVAADAASVAAWYDGIVGSGQLEGTPPEVQAAQDRVNEWVLDSCDLDIR